MESKIAAAKTGQRLDDPLFVPAHGFCALLGLAYVGAGIAAITMDGALQHAASVVRYPLFTFLLGIGTLVLFLAAKSLRGSRPAWAFLASISLINGIGLFFAAPRLRGAFELAWHFAFLPSAIWLVSFMLLMSIGKYFDPQTSA